MIAERREVAYGRWQQITVELRETRAQLGDAQDEYQRLQDVLEARAREAYIVGPGSGLEFLLGATSIADLSARVEYMNALSEEDVDLAPEVQNLRNTLSAEKQDQERLQSRAAKALRAVETEEAALKAKLDEAEGVLADLNDEEGARGGARGAAREAVPDASSPRCTGSRRTTACSRYCPVDQPRAVYDGFGAPRYGGGYHPHAGNDIIAPHGTPIRATFDGVAQTSINSLGGYAVYVYGELGYTYNAHLMQPGVTGSVTAGEIIGYVGTTGNASTPHNHFEWHPKVIPTDWPASPYGYSVIGTAVNPFPLLAQVC